MKFEKLSMLVVEDTQPMLKLLVSVLEALGIRNVQTANNGEAAYKAFLQNNHDIVLSDWQMSPVDGIALTHLIRKDIQSRTKSYSGPDYRIQRMVTG